MKVHLTHLLSLAYLGCFGIQLFFSRIQSFIYGEIPSKQRIDSNRDNPKQGTRIMEGHVGRYEYSRSAGKRTNVTAAEIEEWIRL